MKKKMFIWGMSLTLFLTSCPIASTATASEVQESSNEETWASLNEPADLLSSQLPEITTESSEMSIEETETSASKTSEATETTEESSETTESTTSTTLRGTQSSTNQSSEESTDKSESLTKKTTETTNQEKVGKYVTVKKAVAKWQGSATNFSQNGDFNKWMDQTLTIAEQLQGSDNQEYYLLVDNQNQETGYVRASDVTVSETPGGAYYSYGKYVTITSPNYNFWKNFNFSATRNHSSNYTQQTLEARGYYNHFNGSRYLSLYDNKGNWVGYINENATRLANNKGGVYQSYGKYVTITSPNYNFWQNFNFSATRNHSSNYNQQVLEARGYYNHFNGSRYLSLYDNKGNWVGYINENATRLANNKGGVYQSYGKYVTITSPNYNFWQNFNFSATRNHSSNYNQQVLEARGYYNHFNDSRYLSLYDNKGNWVGYINENATKLAATPGGEYKSYGDYVVITSKNYNIWQNFNWKKRDVSSKYIGGYVQARGYYDHFNGSRYLSLYDSQGKWIGYINENATNIKQLYNADQQFDQKYPTGKPVHLFVMGHGANDPGAVGSGTNEARFTRDELLPYLQKYAARLKNNIVEFYDPARNMYSDSSGLNQGIKTISRKMASVTEIHLDSAGSTATGGHVIVNKVNGNTAQNRAFAETVKKYSGLWSGVASTNGLSYRDDLLNLNVAQRRDIPYRLVELGFITNANDVARLRQNLDAIAKSMIENATGEKIG